MRSRYGFPLATHLACRQTMALISLVLFGWTAASRLPAVQEPERPQLPNVDKRPERRAASGAAESGSQRAAVMQLRQRLPDAQVDFDPLLGTPRFVQSRGGFLTGRDGRGRGVSDTAADAIAANDKNKALKAFIQEHRAVFGHGPEVVDAARSRRDYVTAHNGMRTVVLQQELDGVDVFEAVMMAHTTKHGELVNIASHFLPNLPAAANAGTPGRARHQADPPVSASAALAAALRDVGETAAEADATGDAASPAGAEKKQKLRHSQALEEADVKLVWLPLERDRLRLCWEVVFTSRSRSELFRVLVDATNGEALVRQGLTEYVTDATYNVFTSDSPSPFSPGHFTPSTVQPPLVSRTLVTLPALNTNASPNGWINDGGNETIGNNVAAHTDRNADNSPDLPRPVGSPFRVFNAPLDLTMEPSTYTNAAVVQLFYLNNLIHDRFYELGFTEVAGNFQSNNFGRGGLGNDAVNADAQDGSGVNNANFSTPPDGSPGRMQMYVWNGPTPDRDGDFDADIVIHEYTHGLSNRRVGGGVGLSALQSRGMGEGWSDFYAVTLLSEPGDDVNGVYPMGSYSLHFSGGVLWENYYFGIRRYPYCTDTNKAPLTFKDIDPAQISSHPGVPRSPRTTFSTNEATSVHRIGEVWCNALWDARANLINKHGHAAGNQLMLQLVTDGMALSVANPNLLESRDAILQADVVLSGGANLPELWAGFAKRGMGLSATSPASSTTSGVVEAYDLPVFPNDVQAAGALLMTETCTPGNGAIDPGETVTVSFGLTNSGTADLTNVTAVLLATGGVTAPGGPQSYGTLLAGGPAVSNAFTFIANGSCGGMITATMAVSSDAADLGTVTFNFMLGTTAGTNQLSLANPTLISIPNSGPATPYPSTIIVSGQQGAVTKATVTLSNFNHTFPSDVDVLLVSPAGQKVMLMSDAGGTATPSTNLVLTAADSGHYDSTGLHQAATQNYIAGENGPGANNLHRNFFTFSIPTLSGTIVGARLVLYTGGIATADASETYQLRQVTTPVATVTAGGSGLVSIYNDLGDGTSFGARAFTTNESSQVIAISLNSSAIADIVAHAGTSFAIGGSITSLDADTNTVERLFGGTGPATDVQLVLQIAAPATLTFDDAAPTGITSTNLVSGTFKPTDFSPGDVLINPAPAGPYVTNLSTFNGFNPNGTWQLFVVDDTGGDVGAFSNGWSLNLTVVSTNGCCIDPAAADLQLTIVDAPDPVLVGSNVTFTVTVLNNGPATATGVALTNVFPTGATFISSALSQGSLIIGPSNVTATLGTLAPGASASMQVVMTTLTTGTLSNSAFVAGAQYDYDTSNNGALATTLVNLPSFSISDVTVTEGDAGTTNAVFTVTSTPAYYGGAISVTVTTANGGAVAPADYTATNGVLVFAPGVTNQLFTVLVNSDLLNESNETFFANLSSPTGGATIADASGLGTILNNDPLPTLILTNLTITEGNVGSNNAFLTVRLSAPSGRTVTVGYATSNGTATAGSDYAARATNLTINAGVTNTSISISIFGDVLIESNETFFVNFGGVTNAVLGGTQSTITINNNDGLPGQLDHFSFNTIGSPQTAFIPFPVTLTALDASNDVVTGFNGTAVLRGTTAGGDGSLIEGFESGVWPQAPWTLATGAVGTVSSAYAHDGNFGLRDPGWHYRTDSLLGNTGDKLSWWINPGTTNSRAYLGFGASAAGTWSAVAAPNTSQLLIQENAAFAFATRASVSQSWQSNKWYKVSVEFLSTSSVTCKLYDSDGTTLLNSVSYNAVTGLPGGVAIRSFGSFSLDTIASGDFGGSGPVAVSPTLTGIFTNGVWSGLVSVLQGATNMVLRAGDNNGHTNDSSQFNVIAATAITASQASALEGAGMLTFNVRLSQSNTLPISANYITADGTATAGSDYTATAGVLNFIPGETNKVVNVPIAADAASEFDETFTLQLSGAVNAVIATPSVDGTILNDDPLFPLSSSAKREFPQANGAINTFLTTNGVTYFGGTFTEVGLVNSGKFVPFDLASGEPVGTPGEDFPIVDNSVNAVIPDGAGGWYAGGLFTSVGGVPRHRLVHLLADRSVDPTFVADCSGTVNALALHGSNLYAGGTFTTVTNGGVATNQFRLAVLNAATGAPRPTAFQTDFNNSINALSVGSNLLYIGGFFTNLTNNGSSFTRLRAAAVDLTTGQPTAFTADADAGSVSAVAVASNAVYLGGTFTNINGSPRLRIAQVDPVTGALTAWAPAFSSTVDEIEVNGGTVIAGGFFTAVTNNSVTTARSNLLALDAVTGDPTGWVPAPSGSVSALAIVGNQVVVGGTFTNIGGLTDVRRLALVDLTTGAADPAFDPDVSSTVNAVAVQGGIAYAGGSFSFYNGILRNRLAAFDSATGDLLPWNPNASSTVNTLAASGTNIYAGGAFTSIGGITRIRLAAVNSNGAVNTGFSISFNNTVRALLVVSNSLYVGGDFSNYVYSAVTTSNRGVAMLNPSNAQPNTGFAPNPLPHGSVTNVAALATDGTNLYLGGAFSNVAGLARLRLARVALGSGVVDAGWAPRANTNVNALVIDGTNLYAGGVFTSVTNTGGGSITRNRLAAISTTSGNATGWNPNASSAVLALQIRGTNLLVGGQFTTLGGQSRIRLAEVATSNNVAVITPWRPVMSSDVTAINAASHRIFVGGLFTSVGSLSRANLAVFDPNDPPVVSPNFGPASFTENDPELTLAPALALSDANHLTLTGATVAIASNYVAGEDFLAYTPPPNGAITPSFLSGVLTLNGTATVAEYRQALRSITYFNGSENPSVLPRTIRFVADDGESLSAPADATVTVISVNDPPFISGIPTVTTLEDQRSEPANFTVGDVDNAFGSLLLSFSAVNPALVPPGAVAFSGTNAARALTILPGTNQSGSTLVTVYVSDGTLSNDTSFFLSVLADFDGDGMPDFWELANGLNPADPSDAHTDKDGDGMSNVQEYLSGTGAMDPLNLLQIISVTMVGADAQISFSSTSGKSYLVERTDDLTSGIWTTVADNVPGTGSVVDVLDSGAASQPDRIYRVRLLPLPPFTAAFPSASSIVVGSVGFIDATRVGSFWSAARGDSVQQTFTNSLGTVSRAALDLVVPNNSLNSGAHTDWQVVINGTPVGNFVVPQGVTGAIHHEFTFPPIVGSHFVVRLQVTNEVPSGQGSITLGYAGIHAGTLRLFR